MPHLISTIGTHYPGKSRIKKNISYLGTLPETDRERWHDDQHWFDLSCMLWY